MNRSRLLGARLLGTLIAAAVMAVSAAPVTPARAHTAAQTAARVRFVNATPDGAPLDVLVDSVKYVGGLVEASGYMDATPGERVIHVRAAGAGVDTASAPVTLEAGQRVTLAVVNVPEVMDVLVIVDDVSAPARNAARVKAVHAAVGIGPLMVRIGDLTLSGGLQYREASAAGQVIAGAYDVAVSTPEGAALIDQGGRVFGGSQAVTVFIAGAADPAGLRLVWAESSVLNPDDSSQFRFTHMALGVDRLAVYVNGEPVPVYPEVRFSTVTHYYAAGPGPYRVEVYPVGQGPADGLPLATGTAEIGPQQSVLFAATGTTEAVEITAYPADLGPTPPGTARVQAIHLAQGSPPVRVEQVQGAVLFEPLALGESRTRTIPGGSYDIRLRDAAGAVLMEQGGMDVTAGTLTLLIAFDIDPDAPFISAWVVNAAPVEMYAQVRAAHVQPGAPPIDVYLDGDPLAQGLAYGASAAYRLIPPGRYTAAVYAAGANPETAAPLDRRDVLLGGGDFARTLIFFQVDGGAYLTVVPDGLDLIPAGQARVRFVNAAPGAGEIAASAVEGARWSDTVFFGQTGVNHLVDAGAWTFTITPGTGDPLTAGPFDLQTGTAYTIVLVKGANGLDAVVLEAGS